MAPAKTAAKKTAAKTPEPEEELELEDMAEETEDEAPAKKDEVTFGVRHIMEYLKTKHDVDVTPRDLRNLIRKMAREEKPRVQRNIVPGNKTRYDWPDGLQNNEVRRIIKAVVGGEIEDAKKAALAKLKENKAKKDAAEGKAKGSTKKAAKATAPPADEEVEELEFEDEE